MSHVHTGHGPDSKLDCEGCEDEFFDAVLQESEQRRAAAEHSRAELDRLRRALVWWGNDVPANHGEMGHGQDMRDAVVALIERYGDAQAYHAADEIISLIGRSYDAVDQTLHDLIPEGEWGIDIPDNCTVTDFVDSANPQGDGS